MIRIVITTGRPCPTASLFEPVSTELVDIPLAVAGLLWVHVVPDTDRIVVPVGTVDPVIPWPAATVPGNGVLAVTVGEPLVVETPSTCRSGPMLVSSPQSVIWSV